MREIALDTETTGFTPDTGHRMVEIGCVEMHSRIRTGNVFHLYLNPQRDMPAEAQKVHGLSAEFLADKPLFADSAQSFLDFIGDSPLIIHNAAFDMGFLNYELQLAGHQALEMDRAIDTVKMARDLFPGSPANLDALCRRFEIDLSERSLHGALLDAELLAEVYLEMMGGRQSALTLEAKPTHQPHQSDKIMFPSRSFPASKAELARHQAFISELKNPLWLETSH